MKLDYSTDKLKKEILGIIGIYLDLSKYKVFFFGSRVDGSASDFSDIDVGIEGSEKIDDDTMFRIRNLLSALPAHKVDVVDFKNVRQNFYDTAKQHIEYLN